MRWPVFLLALAGCYDVPKPVCGFRCGPSAACPSDYACADDGFCHVVGSSQAITCPLVDAGIDAFDFWPFIQTLSPEDNATGVSIDTNVSVKFTEQVLHVDAASFTLVAQDDATPVAAQVSYELTTRTATLDPQAPLLSSKRYLATLGDAITDAHGNSIYGKRTWSFKTAHDTSAPVVTMIDPSPGTTGVPQTAVIVVTFSEQIQYPNGGFSVTPGSFVIGYVSQTAVKLTPQGAMAPNTTYTLTMTAAITDLTGNPLANAPITSVFTTGGDVTAPLVVSQIPADADTAVPVTTTVTAGFSEPVLGISATTMTLETGATAIPATVQYLTAGNVARLTPTTPLATATTYTAKLTTGITDASGNALAPMTWSFTTE